MQPKLRTPSSFLRPPRWPLHLRQLPPCALLRLLCVLLAVESLDNRVLLVTNARHIRNGTYGVLAHVVAGDDGLLYVIKEEADGFVCSTLKSSPHHTLEEVLAEAKSLAVLAIKTACLTSTHVTLDA